LCAQSESLTKKSTPTEAGVDFGQIYFVTGLTE
ncbi:MAG: hypothetical protein RL289_19, partial [Actinomycetota bacterium]